MSLKFNKWLSVLASIFLIVNSLQVYLIPRAFSQETDQSQTEQVQQEQVQEEQVESSQSTEQPPEELSPTPTPPIEEQNQPQISESTPTPTPQPIPTPTPETFSAVWLTNEDGSYTTTNPVELDVNYVSPFSNKLIIKFTKLPQTSSQVTIREITTSFDLGEDKQVGSAYEITSDMADGSFSYDLTLPLPQEAKGQDVEVLYAESLDEIANASELSQSKEFGEETVTVKGLDHLTIFVVTTDDPALDGEACVDAGADGEDGCFNSIQEAIDDAEDGDTINVAAGEYDENLEIDKSLSLFGDPGDDSAGPDGGAPLIVGDGCFVIDIDSNDVTVSGFFIDGDGCSNPVIRVNSDVSGATITENDITGGFRGINLRIDSFDNTISNNVIHDNDTGISVTDSFDNTISGNEIYNNVEGVLLRSDDGGNVSGNAISQNNIHNNETGIYAGGSGLNLDGVAVSNNTISENEGYGIYFDGIDEAELTISGNSIDDNESTGIYLSGDGGGEGSIIENSTVTISDNTITSNDGEGIYADIIIDSIFTVTENTIEENSGNGIYICSEGACENSTVTIGDNDLNGNGGAGIYLNEVLDGSEVTISENSVSGNGEDDDNGGVYMSQVTDSTVDILENDILENFGRGIYINDISGSTFTIGEGNNISDNTDTGIYVNYIGGVPPEPSSLTISDNTISSNEGRGIYIWSVDEVSEVEIEGNTISENTDAGVYLDEAATGVLITANTIQSNGLEEETTGIVAVNASGNEAHDNTISGNNVGVNNQDEDGDVFDARENFWGSILGPLHELLNPEGEGDSISDNVLFRPFFLDELLETLSTNEVDPEDLASLLDSGSFSIPEDEDSEAASQVNVNEDLTINVSEDGGTSNVTLPAGTEITRADGSPIDVGDLTADDVTESSLAGLGTGVVVDGALQWGLEDLELEFSQAITLSIFVGTSFNGQTLNVVRSTTGGGGWTSDGIVSPATCVVTAGLCTFQATKASFYAATHTPASSPTSTTQALSSASAASSAPSCSDTKPGSAPVLQSAIAGLNSVSLTWSAATNPVSYYLVAYGAAPGTLSFGNPNVGGSETTSYTVSGLSGGATYYFKVRAGNGCQPGDFSNELSATPGGGVLPGIAVGFAPGVLSVATPEAELKISPTQEVLGIISPSPIQKFLLGGNRFLTTLFIIVIIVIIFIVLKKRRKTKV